MMKKLLILFCISSCLAYSQEGLKFNWPIDSALVITGNYGELRPNHFHAGIDFSTNGKVELPVYSAAAGYVSRIKTSAVGYGKSVYVTHANGKVTLYAHLSSYSLKIDKAIRREQYARKSFEVDYYPEPHSIKVKSGEIIALSGNSGGSTGPHLHFEIRDEKTEAPLNALRYYKYNDQIAPVISHLAFFDLSDTTNPKVLKSITIKAPAASAIVQIPAVEVNSSIVGLAFAGLDRYRLNGNANNIYSIRLYFDEQLIYEHALDAIHFSESRYINQYTLITRAVKFQKCFLPTLYPSSMYGTVLNKGRILLADRDWHMLKMIASDEVGNERTALIKIRTNRLNGYKTPVEPAKLVNCARDKTIISSNCTLFIPARTLFESSQITLIDNVRTSGHLNIQPDYLRLNSPVFLGVALPDNFKKYKDKVVLRSKQGIFIPKARNDSLIFSLKEIGNYSLALDTIPPVPAVHPASAKHKEPWKLNSFSFVLHDNMSGIGRYDLYLNNVWVLAESDAKLKTLTYYFDEETPIGLLQFRVEVEDRGGNRETLFYLLRK